MVEPEHPDLRVSDADRHAVAEILREAAGEGRLDVDELEERLEQAYAAKTYADLAPLTRDLPVGRPPGPPAVRFDKPVPRPQPAPLGHLPAPVNSVAVMSGVDRRGRWEIGRSHTAVAFMGGVGIDLREARFATREAVITANAVMGSVDITVDEYTQVIVEGLGIMGTFEQARDRVPAQIGPDSPVVRVRGVALMGAVTVVRKPPRGTSRWGRQLRR